jgi:hypothetical protein
MIKLHTEQGLGLLNHPTWTQLAEVKKFPLYRFWRFPFVPMCSPLGSYQEKRSHSPVVNQYVSNLSQVLKSDL